MREYVLFIDTEASGLPRNWNAPYWEEGNWPYAVQVSWVVYTREGQPVKEENHYINNNNDFEITPSAIAIHGIKKEFLQMHGESRKHVLTLLTADLLYYEPLVAGHFMKFDALVLGAEYFRTGLENPLESLPTFCTMEASAQYVRNPRLKYLRLGDLYHLLFNTTLHHQHHALVDARATADCFFEMLKRGEIHLESLLQQPSKENGTNAKSGNLGCGLPVLAVLVLSILLSLWI